MKYRRLPCLVAAWIFAAGAFASDLADIAIAGDYAGSDACQGCHTYIYNNWRTTRHSFSVRTASEAKQAGYPLPRQRRGGEAHRDVGWSDLSYIIGGRQRIAYVDTSGRVLDTSFHHRIGDWDLFPALDMSLCRTCHYTGVGNGGADTADSAQRGAHAERNIGCEACHGPGARHVDTLEKSDISKNPSSSVCGQCHTAVGKILPKGELHATHDLVQNWNRDRHVTGVRRQSHNLFCSGCHSPYNGQAAGDERNPGSLVFTEQKLNITCIGCHDPHQLGQPLHSRENATLQSPRPIRAHTFSGNDDDFTTTDHREWDSAAASCLGCHRGADRVDLDHANATCVDCHNTFKRNHSAESRQFHDSNRSSLSCLGCHENADYLMSILYQDPDFLEPRHIHNLRTLPPRVQERYAFRYRYLRPATAIAASGKTLPAADAEDVSPGPEAAVSPAGAKIKTALSDLLQREPHANLAGHAAVRLLQDKLLARPGSPAAHIELAEKYTGLGHAALARELLDFAYRADSSRVLLELPLDSVQRDQKNRIDGEQDLFPQDLAARLDRLLPPTAVGADSTLRQWLQAYLQMRRGRFDLGARVLQGAADSAAANLYRALAEMGQGRYRLALQYLETNLESYPNHHASHAALGLTQFLRKRSAPAESALLRAIEIAPGEGSAHLILGRIRIASGDRRGAEHSYLSAIEAEPALVEARFFLAQAYQLDGRPDKATEVYEQLIDLDPDSFDTRYALANHLKLWSDQIAFRLRAESEKNPRQDITRTEWQSRIDGWQRQVDKLRNRALAELAVARQLRPRNLEVVRQVAEVYRSSGRLEQARKFYQWLSRREPDDWMHRYRLGTIRYALGDYENSVDELRRATLMAPADGDIRLALGLALVRSGRLEQAITEFEKATIYEPFNPALYTNLGAAYASRGDFSRARSALERSLELHSFPLPRVHLTQTNLALVHLRSNRVDEAIIALRRALHSYGDYSLARDLLARADSTPGSAAGWPGFVYNEWLDRFGEVTSIAFADE